MTRMAKMTRKTAETSIALSLNLDGEGNYQVKTGIGFFDHMLSHLAYHGLLDLTIEATGDLEVDGHHIIEDIGILLGQAFTEALGDKTGIYRYGSAIVPMDDALVLVAIDFSGRSFLNFKVPLGEGKIGQQFDVELAEEFFQAFSRVGMNIHITALAGKNRHHLLEAAFKAFGRAVREAVMIDPRRRGIPSTKGILI